MNGEQPISEQQIKTAYWYVTHRAQIVKATTIALVALCITLWGFALLRFTYFLVVEESRTRAAVTALTHNDTALPDRSRYTAQNVQILETAVLPTGNGGVDFFAHIQNPNADYAAMSFSYFFLYEGGETPRQTGYLLPGAEFFLYALGVESAVAPKNAQLIIDAVVWQRIPAWETVRAQFAGLTVRDITSAPLAARERSGVALSFTLANDTAYSFFSVDVPVFFERGGRVVAVNALRLTHLQSGERRPVTFQWFGAPLGATAVRVVPQVHMLDTSVVEKIAGGEQKF